MTQPPSGEWSSGEQATERPQAQPGWQQEAEWSAPRRPRSSMSGTGALVLASAAAGVLLQSQVFVASFVHSAGQFKAFETVLALVAMAAAGVAFVPWLRNRADDGVLTARAVAAGVAAFTIVAGVLQVVGTLNRPFFF